MKQRLLIYPVISAIAIVFSIFFFLPWLSLIAFVPLLIALKNTSPKQNLVTAGIFSTLCGVLIYSWLLLANLSSVESLFDNLLGVILSLTSFIIGITLVFIIWNRLTKSMFTSKSILILASLFTFFEFIYDHITNTLPWHSFHFGNPLIGSIYTIQLAELGGIYILTFSVLLINGFVAYSIKQHKQLGLASLVIGLFFTANLLLFNINSTKAPFNTEVKINKLTPITSLGTLNDSNNKLTIGSLNIYSPTLNQQKENYKIINSAYLVNSRETDSAIDDKVYLRIIEEEETLSKLKNKQPNHSFIVKPNLGGTKIEVDEIFIFNEAIIAPSAAELVKAGAQFLVSTNNDNRLENAYLNRLFFYYNSLRAVENRRDIAIKGNYSYIGKASANGETLVINSKNTPLTSPLTLIKHSNTTLYSQYPYAFILFCKLLFVVVAFLILIKSDEKIKSFKKINQKTPVEVF